VRDNSRSRGATPLDAGNASPAVGTPVAEFAIDSVFVAELLADQHPDLAHLPLRVVDAGWDNAMFRLGDHLAVRLPRRAAAAPLIAHEQIWLPRLADQLALPVPVPYRIGTPARGYPWHWSVVPWLPGMAADQNEPHASQARPFATFLRSLHLPAPADAPTNPVRGVSLRQRAALVEARMHRLASTTSLITPQITHIWNVALNVPLDLPPTWLHGDLHPRNVLVEHGVITGIIDWGDITSGDCATDLASIWMLFADSHARLDALAAYATLSEATLQRAKGWAVLFSVMLLDTGLIDNPRNAVIGERTLRRVAEPM
jgi:aminoglycoside phosphotransferase (APT) family kinase protein